MTQAAADEIGNRARPQRTVFGEESLNIHALRRREFREIKIAETILQRLMQGCTTFSYCRPHYFYLY